MFVSGRFVACAACPSTTLTTVRESFDEQELMFVGEQRCDQCGASLLYSRRAETGEEIAMVKQKKKARATTRKATKAAKTVKAKPRNQDLPGMEDRAIKPLEDAAYAYAEIRDQRIALNAEEVGLKAKLLRLMKQHGKDTYQRNGVTITLVVEEETVKVRVKKAGEDEPEVDAEVEIETADELPDDAPEDEPETDGDDEAASA